MMEQKRSHSIISPYSGVRQSYTTTLTYLLRVPRRLRPALLLTFCLVTFGLVYFNHAMHQATAMDRLVVQRQAAEMSRRYVQAESGAEMGEDWSTQMDIHAQRVEMPISESIVFDSKKDELAALLSVSLASRRT
jgi:hypothetical protein